MTGNGSATQSIAPDWAMAVSLAGREHASTPERGLMAAVLKPDWDSIPAPFAAR